MPRKPTTTKRVTPEMLSRWRLKQIRAMARDPRYKRGLAVVDSVLADWGPPSPPDIQAQIHARMYRIADRWMRKNRRQESQRQEEVC
jgi:hypothetical protein